MPEHTPWLMQRGAMGPCPTCTGAYLDGSLTLWIMWIYFG